MPVVIAPQSLQNLRTGEADAVFSRIGRDFKTNAFVGGYVFPPVRKSKLKGYVVDYPVELGQTLFNTERSPGAPFSTVPRGRHTEEYTLKLHGLKSILAVEEAIETGESLSDDINGLIYGLMFGEEYRQALMIQNPANYLPANVLVQTPGNYLGGDGAANIDPVPLVMTLKEQMLRDIGVEPNLMLMGYGVKTGLFNNQFIKDVLPNDSLRVVDEQKLQSIFGIKKVAIGSTTIKSGFSANSPADFVWGNFLGLYHIHPPILERNYDNITPYATSIINEKVLSYGMNFVYGDEGGTHPIVTPIRRCDETHTDYIQSMMNCISVVTKKQCGILVINPVKP